MLANFEDHLGFGQDGKVWKTSRHTAIKVFERIRQFKAELGCYQRLAQEKLAKIDGLQIPQLVDFDEALMIVEMTIVNPPFLIDFGKCYLDERPPYDESQKRVELAKLRRVFKDNFSRLQGILWKLEQIGIYYVDARPANIRFFAYDESENEILDDESSDIEFPDDELDAE